MAETFSCTLAFRSSYRRNTCRKIRLAGPRISGSAASRKITAAKNTRLSRGLTDTAMTTAQIMVTGAQTHIRRIIW